jgi:predicted nucleic acid-binding protein
MLIDTSALGRLANRADVSHAVAKAAVAELHRQGKVLYVTAHYLVEFRNFATRPVKASGLGLTATAAKGSMTWLLFIHLVIGFLDGRNVPQLYSPIPTR